MITRKARLGDTHAVGSMICDALAHSPSSVFDRADLAVDEFEVGRELMSAPLAAGDLVWVLEAGQQIAGFALARARTLHRSSHVADLALVVHPIARGRGGGATLLAAIEGAARDAADLHKLVHRVAVDDEALKATLRSSSSPWVCERHECEGLRRGAHFVDTELWGLVVGAGPRPS